MKIIHVCFGVEHYIDSWGYQQNILPLYHAKLGHDVCIFASNDTYPSFVSQNEIEQIKNKGNRYNNGLVKIIRFSSYIRRSIHFHIAKGVYRQLKKESPQLIFFHGTFNLSIFPCLLYKLKNKSCKIVIDNHGDEYNINRNKIYRFLYYRCFWGFLHFFIQKHICFYYGVTHLRCDFIQKYIKINRSKIKLLPIGADVDNANSIAINRSEKRCKLNYKNDDIIIVHGGKLDERKGTKNLVEAFIELEKIFKVKLVLFGDLIDQKIYPMIEGNLNVVHLPWLSRNELFELLSIADIAVWPIHHTTLIEDSIAIGLPVLIRKTKTTEHLINSSFYLESGNKDELVEYLKYFCENQNIIANNISKLRDFINYYNVAEQVLIDTKLTNCSKSYQ